jgi:hypothetical protein
MGGFSNPKQPQLELKPFDADRLKEVAAKLRELYPAQARAQVASKVTNDFIERLVAEVTTGFRGDVGVVPRQFLRQFVDVLDLTDDNPDFDPMTAAGFEPKALTEAEQHLQAGRPLYEEEPEDQEGYAAVEF